MRIRQIENEILAQWAEEIPNTILFNTEKCLLIKTEKGLLTQNFDEKVQLHVYISFGAVCLSLFSSNAHIHKITYTMRCCGV